MSDKDKADALAIVAKLAQEERRLAEGTFLAPVVGGGRVRIRLQGIVYELKVDDGFEGWAMLQMTAPGKAKVVDQPSPALVGKYLRLFPRVRMVLLQQFGKQWFGLPASNADNRLNSSGPIPINLIGASTRFSTVNCRYDGTSLWFESIDRRRDPSVARGLNDALNAETNPAEIRCRGMVPQEKLAYKMLWLSTHDEEPCGDLAKVVAALRHAGAHMEGFWYNGNETVTVRMNVDGNMHNVTVRPGDLTVVSAGICLSGRDEDFDLASLVSVLREGRERAEDWDA